jgi:L-Ala-D/L-Glu epimerase
LRAEDPRLDRKVIELRLRHAWTLARGTSLTRHNVLTRLVCDGIEAFGEAAPNPRYGETAETVLTALETLALLIGTDPERYEEIIDAAARLLPEGHAARASLDIALHDWIGKRRGIPLWRMLGADPGRASRTSMSIGIDEVPVMQEKIREAEGFEILKVKLGTARDREILAGVRAVTDRPLYVDANEGWTDEERAVEQIRFMEGMGVVLVEQPLPAKDLEAAKRVRDRVALPLITDEAVLTIEDIEPLAQAYDGINVKLQKAGGLRVAVRMIEKARALGLKVMLGCMIETSVGVTAAAHLASLADYVDLDGHLLISNDPFRGVAVQRGRLVLPDGPGLGVERLGEVF